MHFKLMLITLIFTGNIQQAYSCSTGPEIPPTRFDTVNEYKEADQVLLAKIIDVKRDPSEQKKIDKRYSLTVKSNNTKIAYFKTKISALNKTPDFKSEIKSLKDKLKKVKEDSKYIDTNLRKTNRKISMIYRKETFDHSLENQLNSEREKIIDTALANKMQQLKLENQLKIINLKKYYLQNKIREFHRNINHLESLNDVTNFSYDGPITVKMEVIETYKGKNTDGKIISFQSQNNESSACISAFYSSYLYTTNKGRYVLLNLKNKSVVSWDSTRLLSGGIDKTLDRIRKKMMKVKSGKYRDRLESPTLINLRKKILGKHTAIYNK